MKLDVLSNRFTNWLRSKGKSSSMPEEAPLDQARLWAEQQRLTQRLVHGCAFTLLALLAWSAIATVPQAAHGEARVVPSQRLQVVQAVDGGVINAVYVREGQQVKAGDTLIVVESMKMEFSITAPHDATVHKLLCREGAPVAAGQDVLVLVEATV